MDSDFLGKRNDNSQTNVNTIYHETLSLKCANECLLYSTMFRVSYVMHFSPSVTVEQDDNRLTHVRYSNQEKVTNLFVMSC